MWLIILSAQLPIVPLVGLYPTNQLKVRRPISSQKTRKSPPFPSESKVTTGVSGISTPFAGLSQILGQEIYAFLARAPLS